MAAPGAAAERVEPQPELVGSPAVDGSSLEKTEQEKQPVPEPEQPGAAASRVAAVRWANQLTQSRPMHHWNPTHVSIWIRGLPALGASGEPIAAWLRQRGTTGHALQHMSKEQLERILSRAGPDVARVLRDGTAQRIVDAREDLKNDGAYAKRAAQLKILKTCDDPAACVWILRELQGDEAVCSAACERLCTLVKLDRSRQQEAAVRAGFHRQLLSTMARHRLAPAIVAQCCRSLGTMAFRCPRAQTAIGASGVQAITEAMQRHSEHVGVQEHACTALHFLAFRHDANQSSIRQAGGVWLAANPRGAFVRWRADGVPTVFPPTQLEDPGPGPEPEPEPEQEVEPEPHVEPETAHLSLQERAYKAGLHVCRPATELQSYEEPAGMHVSAQEVLTTLERYGDDRKSALSACRILATLGQGSGAVVGAVLRTMELHRQDADVQATACFALANLCRDCPLEQPAAEAAVACVRDAMATHPSVQEDAASALRSLLGEERFRAGLEEQAMAAVDAAAAERQGPSEQDEQDEAEEARLRERCEHNRLRNRFSRLRFHPDAVCQADPLACDAQPSDPAALAEAEAELSSEGGYG